MADEIAQVIQIEMQGMTMAIKGTVQMAEWFMMAMKALMEHRGERKERKLDKRLEQPGEKSFKQILDLSVKQGGVVQYLEVPEELMEKFSVLMQREGLRYHFAVDFNDIDKKRPIFFPPHDLLVAKRLLDSLLTEDVQEINKEVDDIEQDISEWMEKWQYADANEKKEIQLRIENLQQAKEEKKDAVKEEEDIIRKKAGSLQEYLQQAKNTEFEKDPDKALSELESGVIIGKKVGLKTLLQPMRDKRLMPESQSSYYLTETGIIIFRVFEIDSKTGLLYSNYNIKTNSGEKYEFSDRDITKAEWNEKILPQILEKAGAIEGTSCRVFNSEERLNAYLKHHNQVKPKSEENIEKLREEGKEVFSSADAKAEIEYALSQDLKAMASATWDKDKVEFAFPEDKVTRSNGKLRAELEDGSAILFNGVQAEGVENGKCYFSVKQGDEVFLEKKSDDVNARPLIKTSVADIKESMKKQEQANAAQQKDRIRGAGR